MYVVIHKTHNIWKMYVLNNHVLFKMLIHVCINIHKGCDIMSLFEERYIPVSLYIALVHFCCHQEALH